MVFVKNKILIVFSIFFVLSYNYLLAEEEDIAIQAVADQVQVLINYDEINDINTFSKK